MRATRLAIATVLGALAATVPMLPAQAADAPGRYPIKGLKVEPRYSWTGFYFGVNVGGAWGSADGSYEDSFFASQVPGISLSPEGWFGGVQTGYNYQFTNNVVLGIEADVQAADINGSTADGTSPGDTITAKSEYFGTVRLRLGYAFDRFLPYVTGGLAWANSKVEASDGPLDDSAFSWGWAAGAGMEYAVGKFWTLRAEYLHADLGDVTYFEGQPWQVNASSSMNLGRVAANLKF